MQIDLIALAELLSAAGIVLGVIIGGYKLFDKAMDRITELERRVKALEAENDSIRREDAIVIFALRACLDGLHQQGCNGKVTEAIEMIDKHINKTAHKQE